MPATARRIDAAWFTEAIKRAGISQRTLATRIGLHQASLSRALKGERRLQTAEARSIADALGVPFADVLRHAGINVRDEGDDIEKRHRAAVRMVRTLLGVIDEHSVPLPKRVREQADSIG